MADKEDVESSKHIYRIIGYAPPILVCLAVFVTLFVLNFYLRLNEIISQDSFLINGQALLIGFFIMNEMINITLKVARKIAMFVITTVIMVAFLWVTYLTLSSFLGWWQYFGFAVGFAVASYLARILLAYNRGKKAKNQNIVVEPKELI